MSDSANLSFPKKLRNKTLSARKQPLKTIRNTLSSKTIDYWPILKNQDDFVFRLENHLKNMNLRKERSAELPNAESPIIAAKVQKCVLFGIKEIARSIKNNECAVLIIDANTPRILVSHLIFMAVMHHIPVCCIVGLHNLLDNNVGFKSSSVSFRKMSSRDISDIIDIIKSNECTYSIPSNFSIKTPPNPIQNIPLEEKQSIGTTKAIYLYRTNKTERMFHPPSSDIVNIEEPKETSLNYIKISNNLEQRVAKCNYKNLRQNRFNPLQIKRIRNNTNRKKNVTKN